MARTCELCGRSSMRAKNRSHSKVATIKKQKVNLQTLIKDGRRVLACANCIRTETKKMKQGAIA